MKKKFLLILSLIITTAALSGCDRSQKEPLETVTDIPEQTITENESSGNIQTDAGTNSVTEQEQKPEFKETEDIFFETKPITAQYESIEKYNIIDMTTLDGSKYSVFYTETEDYAGGWSEGIVDINGNVILEPALYSDIGWCPRHEVIYASFNISGTDYVPELEGYIFDTEHGGHEGPSDFYYLYHVEQDTYYGISYGLGDVTFTKVDSAPILEPYIVYHSDEAITDENHAVFYEDTILYNELMNGLYGEGMEFEMLLENGRICNLGICFDMPLSFTNGYIHFMRDGKYGYINSLGEEVTGFIYDDCEPAYDGFAWVKLDGKWQTVNLERT